MTEEEDERVKEIIAEIFRALHEHNIPEHIGLSALGIAYIIGMYKKGESIEHTLEGMKIAIKTIYENLNET